MVTICLCPGPESVLLCCFTSISPFQLVLAIIAF